MVTILVHVNKVVCSDPCLSKSSMYSNFPQFPRQIIRLNGEFNLKLVNPVLSFPHAETFAGIRDFSKNIW